VSELIPHLGDDPGIARALGEATILYTDLDGTLVSRGCLLTDAQGVPSDRVAHAIVEVNRAGLTVVPVSGRGVPQLTEVVRLLGWKDFIAEAGAITVRGLGADSVTVYETGAWGVASVGAGGGPTPFERIEAAGAIEALFEAFPGRLEYHDPWHEGREVTHLLRGCVDASDAQTVLNGLELAIDIVDNGIIRNRGSLTCEGPPHAYHLVPRGVSKAEAIRADLEARGLGPEDAISIGDSATDLEMADVTGVFVLVANGLDSEGVRTELEARPRPNVVRTHRVRGEGWAEFADAWLVARAL
jgi:phosphoglycolate phosphatase-like HAD superfamily hydrolase